MNHHVSLSRLWISVGVLGLGQVLNAADEPAKTPADDHQAKHSSAQPGKAPDDAAKADAAAAAKDPNSYGNKETYPHSVGNASPTALIGGGNTAGGSFTPSASAIAARIVEWKLGASDIQAALDKGGNIERTKEVGADQPTGNMEDEALHTLINNRLLADHETVRVTTQKTQVKNGEVNMECIAATPEMIGKTIAIVLDTPGVTKVTAKAKIDATLPGSPGNDASRIPADKGAERKQE